MKFLSLIYFCLFFSLLIDAQHFPGGVTDAEVWYICDWEDIEEGIHENSALTDIEIENCYSYDTALFNFNPSLYSKQLCLKYDAPLENSTGRNAFFVGESIKPDASSSHLGTYWNPLLIEGPQKPPFIRNFFDFNSESLYSNGVLGEYQSDKDASVNFYHTNHYNIDRKFKSYGQLGETTFYIGKTTITDSQENYEDYNFWGNFPEFVSFTRELSSNERNRVESYLALKYGLTLGEEVSYLNSGNKVFWGNSNNDLFSYRIFGFGKDDISELNQLQSESTHLKGHLVAAIEEILATNTEKQELVNIPDKHFLVFGDNNEKPALLYENSKNILFWKKAWLAQRTGEQVEEFPVHFRLYITNEIREYLIENDGASLWLMQDKYTSNDEVSNFDNEYIEYYTGDVNFNDGTAYFEDVYFDTDVNIYDQFTFGVGSSMIVQAQVEGCQGDDIEVGLIITGGDPNYTIKITSSLGTVIETTSVPYFYFEGQPSIDYTVIVTDSEGLEAEVEFTPSTWDFGVDLGPDQYLNASNSEITLNAGSGINDPDAMYQWYQDDLLLPDSESILVVNEAGVYEVVVTSGDLSCIVTDQITILNEVFEVDISLIHGCGEQHNSISINIEGGIPPFTTNLEGANGTVNYVHSGSTVLTDLGYGIFTITITDDLGEMFEEEIELSPPIDLDIYSQLEMICGVDYPYVCINYDYQYQDIAEPFFIYNGYLVDFFTLDASIGANDNPNITYEWFENGESIGSNPIMSFINWTGEINCHSVPGTVGGHPIFTIIATDTLGDCVYEQSFISKGICADPMANGIIEPLTSIEDTDNKLNSKESISSRVAEDDNNESLDLITQVYPNPSKSSTSFTYEVESKSSFDGIVEVFTIAGEKLYSVRVNGASSYVLPLQINISGMYFIKITSSIGITKIDRIIII